MLLKIDCMKVESNVRRIYYAWNELGEWLLLLRIHGENALTRITAGDSFHDFTLHLVQVEFPILVWHLRIRGVRGIIIAPFLPYIFQVIISQLTWCLFLLCSSLLLFRIVPMQTILIWRIENYAKRSNQRFIEFENRGGKENEIANEVNTQEYR